MRRGLAHRLLAARSNVKLVAARQPLAEFEFGAAALISRLKAEHVPLDRDDVAEAGANFVDVA